MTNYGIDFSKKVVLHFSGGKDSLVCLYLLKPYWNKLTVMWGNSGDTFPEVREQMEKIAALVSDFVEVEGTRQYIEKTEGYPVDIIDCHTLAVKDKALHSIDKTLKTLPFHECCLKSYKLKMHEESQKFDYVIRGQRKQETLKSQISNGFKYLHQTYIFPIEDWSDYAVEAYLQDNHIEMQPQYYLYKNAKSLDCMGCTAYNAEGAWKSDYMKKHHPETYIKVSSIKRQIKADLQKQLNLMEH